LLVNRPLDESLRLGVFGKLKLVICAPISDLLGIGFFVRTCGRKARRSLVQHPDRSMFSTVVSPNNAARSSLAGVAWLRRFYKGN